MTRCSGVIRKAAQSPLMSMQLTSLKHVFILKFSPQENFVGVESQGMILMAEDHNGKPGFIQTDEQWIGNNLSDNGHRNYGTHYFLLIPTIPT